eukprot:1620814-Prymnesium_polylepis.1
MGPLRILGAAQSRPLIVESVSRLSDLALQEQATQRAQAARLQSVHCSTVAGPAPVPLALAFASRRPQHLRSKGPPPEAYRHTGWLMAAWATVSDRCTLPVLQGFAAAPESP